MGTLEALRCGLAESVLEFRERETEREENGKLKGQSSGILSLVQARFIDAHIHTL